MTIDRAVTKFEKLLNDVNKLVPTVVLSDGSIGYKNYVIKKNKLGLWELKQFGKAYKNLIDSFYLKSSALIAAKQHRFGNIMDLARTKDLDQRYWSNYIDSINFKHLYERTNDPIKKDIYLWRMEQNQIRALQYKDKITSAFNNSFR